MTKPIVSYRRIDRLKALAYDRGFTNEDARQFGKLTKTATWEALLELYLVDGETLDTMLDTVLDNNVDSARQSVDTALDTGLDTGLDTALDNSVDSARQGVDIVDIRNKSTFLDWVDVGQLIALALASVGVFVLAMNLWQQINPLNLFPPVKVNIQIGAKL